MKNGDTLPDGATVSVIIITEILAIGRTYTGKLERPAVCPNEKKRNPFYACLYRNRDLNRNGIIDLDEVRWYVPSAIQLIDLALGDKGLPESVRLYQEDDHSGIRQHRWYVSSSPGNINNGRFPISYGARKGSVSGLTESCFRRR